MPRPWISLNLAISADGKLSSVDKRPSGWTSPEDHARLLELRQSADALMVGRGTLEADRMTLRVPGKLSQPLRCIVSRHGRLIWDQPLFRCLGGPVHLLVTGASLEEVKIPHGDIHTGDLPQFLTTLAQDHKVRHLHCEGGGELIRALAESRLIDELHLTLAGHSLFGGVNAPTLGGIQTAFLAGGPTEFEISGFDHRPELGECFLSYRRRDQSDFAQWVPSAPSPSCPCPPSA